MSREFAMERLGTLRARPTMWAATREAFAAQVSFCLELLDVDPRPHHERTFKIPGTSGTTLEKLAAPVDDDWAHAFVDEAVALVERADKERSTQGIVIVEDPKLAELRAQRDGWRAVALRALQSSDFGEVPPIEFLPETAEPAYDKTDRTPELMDELRRRPFVTEVRRWEQPGVAASDPSPTIWVEAAFGSATIQIQHRAAHSDAYKFSMSHWATGNGSPYLFTPREVSFDLLLRYLDFVIAGYKFAHLEPQMERHED